MSKKNSLLIGILLLILAVCFWGYAANHPEAAFPWSNRVTFLLYGAYIYLIFKFLAEIPVRKTSQKTPPANSLIRAGISFFMAAVFFVMELTMETAGIFTIIRGFIVAGGVITSLESLYVWRKNVSK